MTETLILDPRTTALVLVNLQNTIISRDTKPYSANEVIERSRKLR